MSQSSVTFLTMDVIQIVIVVISLSREQYLPGALALFNVNNSSNKEQ